MSALAFMPLYLDFWWCAVDVWWCAVWCAVMCGDVRWCVFRHSRLERSWLTLRFDSAFRPFLPSLLQKGSKYAKFGLNLAFEALQFKTMQLFKIWNPLWRRQWLAYLFFDRSPTLRIRRYKIAPKNTGRENALNLPACAAVRTKSI